MSYIYRKSTIERLNSKCSYLGKKYSAIKLQNLRVIISLLVFVILLFVIDAGIVIAPIISYIVYHLLEYIFLDARIVKRKYKLEKEGLVLLELILLSMKNKNSFLSSIALVDTFPDSELALEFKLLLDNINKGKGMEEALSLMEKRIPSDYVNNIISSLALNNINDINKLKNKVLEDTKKRVSIIRSIVFIVTILFILAMGIVILGIVKF